MDHIVSYKKGACIKEMYYFKSTAEKVSDLRRWRTFRKNMKRHEGVILFFADGTVFDTFLSNFKGQLSGKVGKPPYWRHYYRLANQPELTKQTLLAYYRCRFDQWKNTVIEVNGINDLKKTKTLCI